MDKVRQDIIDIARSCLNTPFRHQGRIKGQSLDCVGLVRVCAVESGLYDKSEDFKSYKPQPNPDFMKEVLDKYFIPVPLDEVLPGDILWLMDHEIPMHLAIYTDKNTIIHAMYRPKSKRYGGGKVVEHDLSPPFSGSVLSAYRFKGID